MNVAWSDRRLKMPLLAPRLNNAEAPHLVADYRPQRYTIIPSPPPCLPKIYAGDNAGYNMCMSLARRHASGEFFTCSLASIS